MPKSAARTARRQQERARQSHRRQPPAGFRPGYRTRARAEPAYRPFRGDSDVIVPSTVPATGLRLYTASNTVITVPMTVQPAWGLYDHGTTWPTTGMVRWTFVGTNSSTTSAWAEGVDELELLQYFPHMVTSNPTSFPRRTGHRPNPVVPPEEIARRNAIWEAARQTAHEATERAEKLLLRELNPEQQRTWRERGYFVVETFARGRPRRYRIHRGRVRNIDEIDREGRRICTLCAHPMADVPDPDTALAQMLFLKHDPETFLGMANVS